MGTCTVQYEYGRPSVALQFMCSRVRNICTWHVLKGPPYERESTQTDNGALQPFSHRDQSRHAACLEHWLGQERLSVRAAADLPCDVTYDAIEFTDKSLQQ